LTYDLEHIAQKLRAAREDKGFSQRELGALAGVPQSHISKIERGVVDLRLSSLIALSRVLGLELTLVPSKALPAVNSVVQSSERTINAGSSQPLALKELRGLQSRAATLNKLYPGIKDLEQFQRQIKALNKFRLNEQGMEQIRALNKGVRQLKEFNASLDNLKTIRELSSQAQKVRNVLAHSSANSSKTTAVRSAYRLDDEEEDG